MSGMSRSRIGMFIKMKSTFVNALSFDIEDWFHGERMRKLIPQSQWPQCVSILERSTDRILDLLSRKNYKATFFILGWVAEKYPELVKRIAHEGHEIATHGYAHVPIYDQTPLEFRKSLRLSLEILRGVSGQSVLGHRAATFSIVKQTQWAIPILFEEGIRYDSSIFPISYSLYGIPDAPRHPYVLHEAGEEKLIEYPLSTLRFFHKNFPFVGGNYFHFVPERFTEWAIHRLNRENLPAVIYLHPHNLDTAQPFHLMPRNLRWKRRFGLKRNWGRLEKLLDTFPFASMKSVLEQRGLLNNQTARVAV